MPIYRNGGGIAIDVTTLKPFADEKNNVNGTGAYQTMLSIGGKGFLKSFYTTVSASGNTISIRATIDGVVKILLSTTVSNHYIGLITKNDLYASSTAGNVAVRQPASALINGDTAISGYPLTDSTGHIILIDSPIYFLTSLLLEINCVSAVAYYYAYNGGS